MIKQIFMITTGNPFFVDQSGVAEASQKAEHDLSEALNEGYTLFAHYPMQAAQVSGQIFILHKPDPVEVQHSPINEAIERNRAIAITEAIDDVEKEIGIDLSMEMQGVFNDIEDQLRMKKILKKFYMRVVDIDVMGTFIDSE